MSRQLTPNTLKAQLQSTRSPVLLSRILLALALSDYPDLPLSEISVMIDVPYETVRTWHSKFSGGGLNALMSLPTKRRRVTERASPFRAGEQWNGFIDPSYFPVPHAVVFEILTRVRQSGHENWLRDVQSILADAFTPADLVVPSVRSSTDIATEEEVGSINVLQHIAGNSTLDLVETDSATAYWHIELLQKVHSANHPFSLWDYSLPIAFDLHNPPGNAYIGSILLFRRRERGPFPYSFRQSIEGFRPLFLDIFIERVLWVQSRSPFLREFSRIISEVSRESELTKTEEKVLGFLMMAQSNDQIIDSLNIKPNTLRNHLHSIYNKVGVHNHGELLGKVLVRHLMKVDTDE